jgi:hypothetical protein
LTAAVLRVAFLQSGQSWGKGLELKISLHLGGLSLLFSPF